MNRLELVQEINHLRQKITYGDNKDIENLQAFLSANAITIAREFTSMFTDLAIYKMKINTPEPNGLGGIHFAGTVQKIY